MRYFVRYTYDQDDDGFRVASNDCDDLDSDSTDDCDNDGYSRDIDCDDFNDQIINDLGFGWCTKPFGL